jgi:hypothetical protein
MSVGYGGGGLAETRVARVRQVQGMVGVAWLRAGWQLESRAGS